MFYHMRSKKFQIYCLQDTHFTDKLEPYIRSEWGGEVIFNSFTSNARGVCILFNNDFEYKVHKVKRDLGGNSLILDLEIEGKRVTLINLYGPNEDSPEFYQTLVEGIEDFDNDTRIICGDFNLVQDQDLDTYNYVHINNPKARDYVLSMKEELNLVDPFREFHDYTKKYTWRKPNPLKQARLDFFLISENFMSSTHNIEILPGYRSDHSIVVLSILLNEFKKGKGLWKFNNSLLKDREYVETIQKCIQKVKEQYMVPVYNLDYIETRNCNDLQLTISDQLFFETLLIEIRGKTISYAAYKKKQKDQREKQLEKEIKNLEESDTLNLPLLEEKKTELQTLRKEKIQGIMVRARLRWAEAGEKPTKYFCALESRNYTNKTIPKVLTDDGVFITKQDDILNEIKQFYADLYKHREINDLNINEILNMDHPTLSEEEKNELEGEIKEQEVAFVLGKMKNNKSPGSDGFSAEFFKFFYPDLKFFIVNAINEGYRSGILSVTQRQGLITCIPKGEKSRHFIKNWRPITLLNVIYKIASGCIAERIKLKLTKLISHDQTGFISGRYIGENTRFIYDILKYVDDEDIPGLLLIVDFEKAFDSISWDFIEKVLHIFNFGNSMKTWINTFYNGITSSVIQNGFLSDFFPVQRGCRQGDPLSPYIFLLCAEILSLMIKSNTNLKGINIGGIEYTLSQYADDTTILLDGSERSLTEALDTLNMFAQMSGLKMNSSKTKAVWIGSRKFCGETFNHRFKLDWTEDNFTILGINFSCNLDNMLDINYKDKISQIENELKQWSKRILTPFGRITILKTLIISKLNHLFIALPNPSMDTINKLQKKFFNFIWQSGTDRVKREVLMQDYEYGGLKMINLRNYIIALKSTWIRRLIVHDTKYKTLFESKYASLDLLLKRGTEFIKRIRSNNTNPFWKDVLEAWIEVIKNTKISDVEDILSVNIWDNSNILINNEPIFYQRWFEKNICFIRDLISEDGSFLSFEHFVRKFDMNTNYLDYFGIISSVRNYIRMSNIRLTSIPLSNCYLPLSIKEIMKQKKGSKNIYNLINEKIIILKSQRKWNEIFNRELNWKSIYSIPAKSCNNTKLHWFQYRVLHRILATNDFLYKIRIKDNNLCTFCNVHSETLVHLFWSCRIVFDFWDRIEKWINEKVNGSFSIIMFSVFFGISYNQECNKPFNYIIILTKYYIYKCRINKKPLNFNIWKFEIKNALVTEKMIAIKNYRYAKFQKYWGKWIAIFEDSN